MKTAKYVKVLSKIKMVVVILVNVVMVMISIVLGVQLSSDRFIKDAVNLIVRISLKLLICHITEHKCTFMFKYVN